MSAHPNRAGAISAQLFTGLIDNLIDNVDVQSTGVTFSRVRREIYNVALDIAISRAARKFHWAPNFNPDLQVDEAGIVHNDPAARDGIEFEQALWIAAEVLKIARNALAALEK